MLFKKNIFFKRVAKPQDPFHVLAASAAETLGQAAISGLFFQSFDISQQRLLSLANSLYTLLNPKKQNMPPTLQVGTELKSIAGWLVNDVMGFSAKWLELSDAEKAYEEACDKTPPTLDVMGEILKGLSYSTTWLTGKNIWDVSKSVAEKGLEHLPAIGYATAPLLGPTLLNAALDTVMEKMEGDDAQNAKLRPWLEAVGNLIVAFLPKTSAKEDELQYRFARFLEVHKVSYLPTEVHTQVGDTYSVHVKKEFEVEVDGAPSKSTLTQKKTAKKDTLFQTEFTEIEFEVRKDDGAVVPVRLTFTKTSDKTVLGVKSSDSKVTDWALSKLGIVKQAEPKPQTEPQIQTEQSVFDFVKSAGLEALKRVDSGVSTFIPSLFLGVLAQPVTVAVEGQPSIDDFAVAEQPCDDQVDATIFSKQLQVFMARLPDLTEAVQKSLPEGLDPQYIFDALTGPYRGEKAGGKSLATAQLWVHVLNLLPEHLDLFPAKTQKGIQALFPILKQFSDALQNAVDSNQGFDQIKNSLLETPPVRSLRTYAEHVDFVKGNDGFKALVAQRLEQLKVLNEGDIVIWDAEIVDQGLGHAQAYHILALGTGADRRFQWGIVDSQLGQGVTLELRAKISPLTLSEPVSLETLETYLADFLVVSFIPTFFAEKWMYPRLVLQKMSASIKTDFDPITPQEQENCYEKVWHAALKVQILLQSGLSTVEKVKLYKSIMWVRNTLMNAQVLRDIQSSRLQLLHGVSSEEASRAVEAAASEHAFRTHNMIQVGLLGPSEAEPVLALVDHLRFESAKAQKNYESTLAQHIESMDVVTPPTEWVQQKHSELQVVWVDVTSLRATEEKYPAMKPVPLVSHVTPKNMLRVLVEFREAFKPLFMSHPQTAQLEWEAAAYDLILALPIDTPDTQGFWSQVPKSDLASIGDHLQDLFSMVHYSRTRAIAELNSSPGDSERISDVSAYYAMATKLKVVAYQLALQDPDLGPFLKNYGQSKTVLLYYKYFEFHFGEMQLDDSRLANDLKTALNYVEALPQKRLFAFDYRAKFRFGVEIVYSLEDLSKGVPELVLAQTLAERLGTPVKGLLETVRFLFENSKSVPLLRTLVQAAFNANLWDFRKTSEDDYFQKRVAPHIGNFGFSFDTSMDGDKVFVAVAYARFAHDFSIIDTCSIDQIRQVSSPDGVFGLRSINDGLIKYLTEESRDKFVENELLMREFEGSTQLTPYLRDVFAGNKVSTTLQVRLLLEQLSHPTAAPFLEWPDVAELLDQELFQVGTLPKHSLLRYALESPGFKDKWLGWLDQQCDLYLKLPEKQAVLSRLIRWIKASIEGSEGQSMAFKMAAALRGHIANGGVPNRRLAQAQLALLYQEVSLSSVDKHTQAWIVKDLLLALVELNNPHVGQGQVSRNTLQKTWRSFRAFRQPILEFLAQNVETRDLILNGVLKQSLGVALKGSWVLSEAGMAYQDEYSIELSTGTFLKNAQLIGSLPQNFQGGLEAIGDIYKRITGKGLDTAVVSSPQTEGRAQVYTSMDGRWMFIKTPLDGQSGFAYSIRHYQTLLGVSDWFEWLDRNTSEHLLDTALGSIFYQVDGEAWLRRRENKEFELFYKDKANRFHFKASLGSAQKIERLDSSGTPIQRVVTQLAQDTLEVFQKIIETATGGTAFGAPYMAFSTLESPRLSELALPREQLHFECEYKHSRLVFLSKEYPDYQIVDKKVVAMQGYPHYLVLENTLNPSLDRMLLVFNRKIYSPYKTQKQTRVTEEPTGTFSLKAQGHWAYTLDSSGAIATGKLTEQLAMAKLMTVTKHYIEAFKWLEKATRLSELEPYLPHHMEILHDLLSVIPIAKDHFYEMPHPDALPVWLLAARLVLGSEEEADYTDQNSSNLRGRYITNMRAYFEFENRISSQCRLNKETVKSMALPLFKPEELEPLLGSERPVKKTIFLSRSQELTHPEIQRLFADFFEPIRWSRPEPKTQVAPLQEASQAAVSVAESKEAQDLLSQFETAQEAFAKTDILQYRFKASAKEQSTQLLKLYDQMQDTLRTARAAEKETRLKLLALSNKNPLRCKDQASTDSERLLQLQRLDKTWAELTEDNLFNLMLTQDAALYEQRLPLLSPAERQTVFDLTFQWSRVRHLQKNLKVTEAILNTCLKSLFVSDDLLHQLGQSLAKQTAYTVESPYVMAHVAIEHATGFIITPKQIQLFNSMTSQNRVVAIAIMGSGKTEVGLPGLGIALSNGTIPVLMVVPPALLMSTASRIRSKFEVLGRPVYVLNYAPGQSLQKDAIKLQGLLAEAQETISKHGIVMASPVALQALRETLIETTHSMHRGSNELLEDVLSVFFNAKALFNYLQSGHWVLEEGDDVLSIFKSYIRGVGLQKELPKCHVQAPVTLMQTALNTPELLSFLNTHEHQGVNLVREKGTNQVVAFRFSSSKPQLYAQFKEKWALVLSASLDATHMGSLAYDIVPYLLDTLPVDKQAAFSRSLDLLKTKDPDTVRKLKLYRLYLNTLLPMCFEKIPGKDFGPYFEKHEGRVVRFKNHNIAQPFMHADTPKGKKTVYQSLDVTFALSYYSIHHYGLSPDSVRDILFHLQEENRSSLLNGETSKAQALYDQWLMADNGRLKKMLPKHGRLQDIDLNSPAAQYIFDLLAQSRHLIDYFFQDHLAREIPFTDIAYSSFNSDLTHGVTNVGFSGTDGLSQGWSSYYNVLRQPEVLGEILSVVLHERNQVVHTFNERSQPIVDSLLQRIIEGGFNVYIDGGGYLSQQPTTRLLTYLLEHTPFEAIVFVNDKGINSIAKRKIRAEGSFELAILPLEGNDVTNRFVLYRHADRRGVDISQPKEGSTILVSVPKKGTASDFHQTLYRTREYAQSDTWAMTGKKPHSFALWMPDALYETICSFFGKTGSKKTLTTRDVNTYFAIQEGQDNDQAKLKHVVMELREPYRAKGLEAIVGLEDKKLETLLGLESTEVPADYLDVDCVLSNTDTPYKDPLNYPDFKETLSKETFLERAQTRLKRKHFHVSGLTGVADKLNQAKQKALSVLSQTVLASGIEELEQLDEIEVESTQALTQSSHQTVSQDQSIDFLVGFDMQLDWDPNTLFNKFIERPPHESMDIVFKPHNLGCPPHLFMTENALKTTPAYAEGDDIRLKVSPYLLIDWDDKVQFLPGARVYGVSLTEAGRIEPILRTQKTNASRKLALVSLRETDKESYQIDTDAVTSDDYQDPSVRSAFAYFRLYQGLPLSKEDLFFLNQSIAPSQRKDWTEFLEKTYTKRGLKQRVPFVREQLGWKEMPGAA